MKAFLMFLNLLIVLFAMDDYDWKWDRNLPNFLNKIFWVIISANVRITKSENVDPILYDSRILNILRIDSIL